MKRISIILLFMATLMVAMSFIIPAPHNGSLTISFQHFVGNKALQLDTATYINARNQPYTITKLKYYIGKIQLIKPDGIIVGFDEYHLINEEEESSKHFLLDNIPFGGYSGIEFIVGVDSADNCSGAQSGALDPINAMFWAWNTGYIFLKLEGKSPASKSPGTVFEYHIGGYRLPTNCIRKVKLTFPNILNIGINTLSKLSIKSDVSEILKNPMTVDFSKLSSVTDFHNAPLIANNYMDMFSVMEIK